MPPPDRLPTPARSLLAHRADLEAAAEGNVMPGGDLSAKLAQWEDAGWCLLEGLFPPADLAAAQAVVAELFPTAEAFASDEDPERNEPFRIDSHSVMPRFPFEHAALNRLVVHDAVIDLAEDFLGRTDLRLYQGMMSAKYSGGAAADEQLLHVD